MTPGRPLRASEPDARGFDAAEAALPQARLWSAALRALGAGIPPPDVARQAIGLELPIAVINLLHRADRWEAIRTRLHAVGLDRLTHVPAVVGARLDLDAIAPLLASSPRLVEAPPVDHFALTRPAVGCFLSHLCVWQWMLDHELPRLLVCEDDARPSAAFDAAVFRRSLDATDARPDLTFPGCSVMDGLVAPAAAGELARLWYFTGTFSYVITPAAARFLIPRLLPMRAHIDHEISRVLIEQRQRFVAVTAEPALIEPDWSLRSDCYVPLSAETAADAALAARLRGHRDALLAEGRRLRPAFGAA
jgi:GR25 family glycosyltransferase involved in LPS biosynthesis